LEKIQITVWDYENKIEHRWPKEPVKLEVDAWCVQGVDGFRAWFWHGDLLVEAHGDDGHWWVVGCLNKYWLKEFQEVVAAIEIG
jgi:hypothetical protein